MTKETKEEAKKNKEIYRNPLWSIASKIKQINIDLFTWPLSKISPAFFLQCFRKISCHAQITRIPAGWRQTNTISSTERCVHFLDYCLQPLGYYSLYSVESSERTFVKHLINPFFLPLIRWKGVKYFLRSRKNNQKGVNEHLALTYLHIHAHLCVNEIENLAKIWPGGLSAI